MGKRTWPLALGLLLAAAAARAAELILPQDRTAFYCDEAVEVAGAGLGNGATALVELAPRKTGLATLRSEVKGDGSTPAVSPAASDYIDRIAGPARAYGFPDWYVERLESFRQGPVAG
jgi:hypothetical protein